MRRSRADTLSCGDFAVATATTALIDLVDDLRIGGVDRSGGYSLRHSMPLHLAASACDALLAVPANGAQCWAGYRVDLSWFRLPGRSETLRGFARVEYATSSVVRFGMEVLSNGARCAIGWGYYVRVHGGLNLATGNPINIHGQKFVATSPKERPSEYHYSPFLVNLLMDSASGSGAPLGRRLHPLSTVPLGAAAFQALRAKPRCDLSKGTMRWISPIQASEEFTASTLKVSDGTVRVSLSHRTAAPFAIGIFQFAERTS